MSSPHRLVRCELEDMDVIVLELELPPPPLPELSAGEAEVAMLVGEGLSNAAIARARGVSQRTVASQLRSVFRKLELGSRWALSLLLTRRAVARVAHTTTNRTQREPERYEPFGRPDPGAQRWVSNPIAPVLAALDARTAGRLDNHRRPDADLRQALADRDLATRARTVIRVALIAGRRPRVASVAAALSISVRTLQRQLRSDGLCFRSLLLEARDGEARRRLRLGHAPAAVAQALGYASGPSLSRALRSR